MKIFLPFLFALFLFNDATALEIKYLQYNASLYKNIESFNITCSGNIQVSDELFFYSLNNSPYVPFNDVRPLDNDVRVQITDLELKEGENTLSIIYKDNSNIEKIDTIITFITPNLSIMEIQQGEYQLDSVNNVFLLESDLPVRLELKYNFQFLNNYTKINGNSAIENIHYKLRDATEWNSINEDEGTILLSGLKFGLNQLLIKAETDNSYKYLPDTISFFYIHFELPESVWKQDALIKLSGNPSGGWFTGSGIVENSNYFNPNDANPGTNEITYHYPLNGEIVSVTKEIEVKEYDFSVDGDLTVCRNSRGQYEILNYDDENFTYDWEVENGGIQMATGVVNELLAGSQTEYIKWNTGNDVNGNFGYVIVTAIHKSTGKQFTENVKIYIKESEAEGIPNLFFGDTENRLLVCDNPDAVKYIWIKDDEPEVITDYNYNYFNSPGTEFRLILETDEGCRTEGFLSVNENSVNAINKSIKNPVSQNLMNKGFSIYPNPAQNKLNLLLKESEGVKTIQIYNSTSQVMFETSLKEGHFHKEISVLEYPPGQYIIKITQGDSFVTGQFIKIN